MRREISAFRSKRRSVLCQLPTLTFSDIECRLSNAMRVLDKNKHEDSQDAVHTTEFIKPGAVFTSKYCKAFRKVAILV